MGANVPFIGRAREINAITEIIRLPKGSYIICIGGDGGIGKSRLLREVYNSQQASNEKPTFRCIIDFDDLIYSTPKNVLHKIAQLVAPDAFKSYFPAEMDFQNIHNNGVSAAAIGEFRKKVDAEFVNCFNSVAINQRIVLCFDSTDKVREEHAIEKSLFSIVPKLKNTVTLLAGRNAHLFHQFFHQRFGQERSLLMELRPFSERDSKIYLKEKGKIEHVKIESNLSEALTFLAEGKPIFLDLAVDLRAKSLPLEWLAKTSILELKQLKGEKKSERFEKFQQYLVAHVRDLPPPMDRLILMIAHVYPLNAEMLAAMANFESDAQSLLKAAAGYSFVKTLPGGFISLLDVMRDMINTHVWPRIPAEDDQRIDYSRNALKVFKKGLERLEDEIAFLEKKAGRSLKSAAEEPWPPIETEEMRQQVWALRKQILHHALIADIDNGLDEFVRIYADAATDSRVTLRPQFILLVEEKRALLSDAHSSLLDYYTADQLFSEDDFDRARSIIEKLLKKDSLAPDLQIRCLILNGKIKINQGEIDAAVTDFKTAVTESQRIKAVVLFIQATSALGQAYHNCGHLEPALGHYKKAWRLYHHSGAQNQHLLTNDQGLILNNMAVILSNNNQTRKAAIDTANTAISHWKKIGNKLGLGRGYLAQGICYHMTDHSQFALNAFQKALNIFKPLGLNDYIATTLSWRGTQYHNIKRQSKAEKDLLRSLEIGLKNMRPMTLNRLGRVYMRRQDWRTAEQYLEESLLLAKEIPDFKYWLASISRLIHIAAKLNQADRYDSFIAQLEECLKKNRNPDKNAEGVAYLGLARLAFIKNSRDNVKLIVNLLKAGIPHIVVYGSLARTDIVTRLDTIEDGFHQTSADIIQEVGRILIEFLYEKEKDDVSYSAALEVMFRWANWSRTDSG